MSNHLCIFLTEESFLAKLAGIRDIEFTPPLGFNAQTPFYIISESVKSAKSSIEESDTPQAVLAYDSIEMDAFCKTVSKVSNKYDEIIIVYHTWPKHFNPNDVINNTYNCFKDKSELICGQHIGNDSLYRLALRLINTNGLEEVKLAAKEVFDVLKSYSNSNK